MKYTKKEKHLLNILRGAEELIADLDPTEKNKKLMRVYKFLHSFNTEYSCFKVHSDWREEFRTFLDKK